MTNTVNREPVINATLPLIPLAVYDENGLTGTVLDMDGYPANQDMLAILQAGTVANVDAAFVAIEESYDNITFTPLAHFAQVGVSDATQIIKFRRTKRYVRAVLTVEFVQPDPVVVVSLPITAFFVL